MKKIILLILVMVLGVLLWGSGEDILGLSGKSLIEYEQLDAGRIILDFELGIESYSLNEMNTESQELPIYSRLVEIPSEGNVTYEIISSKQETLKQEFYTQSEFAGEIVRIGEPAIMRDVRLVAVTFCPFQYDAGFKELNIYHNIKVEISVTGRGGINSKTSNRKSSRAYDNLYQSVILNKSDQGWSGYANNTETGGMRAEFQRPSLLIIYPDYPNVAENMGYLRDWKEQKGFEVNMASTGDIGTSNIAIKAYIQGAYDTWENPPEYVILVGDVNGDIVIPTWTELVDNGEGDNPYSLLEGDDLLSDVMIGRFSVQNNLELQTMIAKAINYEKQPYLGNLDWYEKAILFVFGGESKIACCEAVGSYILQHNSNYEFTRLYNGQLEGPFNTALNQGSSYVCMRDELTGSGWNIDSIANLNNGWMLPFTTMVTCISGTMSIESIAEEFAKAGTSSNPKGGIAVIGTSTATTSTCFNNAMTGGAFYGIFMDNIYTPGGALLRGKLNIYEQYPQNPNNHVNRWLHCNNLFGDPSIDLWTGVPQAMNVFCEEEFTYGANNWQVYILDENGAPLDGALVTVRGGEYYQTGFTDVSGMYYLDQSGMELGEEYEVTITCHNKIPFLEEFEVVEADLCLGIEEIILNDSGNDGIANPGEEISIGVVVYNYGNLDAEQVTLELVTDCRQVELICDETVLGSIISGETIENNELLLEVAGSALGGITAHLLLKLHCEGETWTVPLELDIVGVNLNINSFTVSDENGLLEPGETAECYFDLENLGGLTATGIEGELYCRDNRLMINISQSVFGDIQPGEVAGNSNDSFQITAGSEIIPGTQILLWLHLSSGSGYDQELMYILEIGAVSVTDPLGPDDYGYWCYDDEDSGYEACPEYEWIDIEGIGTLLDLEATSEDVAITDVNIPAEFNFVFYGMDYDLITVSTSGWISPGGSDVTSFTNWIIPGPMGPSPLIAAFWDDLYTQEDSEILVHYNEFEHYYIIEWLRMYNENDNELETFEVIIYDAEHYPTVTGDSEIKIQYQIYNNVNIGIYDWSASNHGQYCTIGLEDASSTYGLQYTYNNEYPVSARALDDESAILFTTGSLPENMPWLRISDCIISSDEMLQAGEETAINLVLENIGGVPATNIEVEALINDPFISISNTGIYIEQINSGETSIIENAFQIIVSDYVPDQYSFTVEIWLESEQGSWNEELEFTAYKQSSLIAEPDSLDLEILWGEQLVTGITLSNQGELPQNYYIELVEMETNRRIALRGIVVEPSEGRLAAGASEDISINVDTSSMEEMEYNYELVISSDNWETIIIPIRIAPSQGGNQIDEIPEMTKLKQNYPNPFNPETMIRYELAGAGNVSLEIFNIKGQIVKTLIDEYKLAGNYEISWDGTSGNGYEASSGIYLYRLKTERDIYSRRMLLLK